MTLATARVFVAKADEPRARLHMLLAESDMAENGPQLQVLEPDLTPILL